MTTIAFLPPSSSESALEAAAGLGGDLAAGRRCAGERDDVDVRALDERIADLGAASR